MIVSIMQPAYLPWLGYFDRLQRSDLHIVLDSVPLGTANRNNFTTRNRVRRAGPANEGTWLTVPVAGGQHDTIIRDVMLANQPGWARKHAETLRHSYARAPFASDVADIARVIQEHAEANASGNGALASLLDVTTERLCEKLDIRTPMVLSSSLPVTGTKSALILSLCVHVGATTYVSGPFGRDYLDLVAFTKAGVQVEFHDYAHPTYTQQGEPFVPYLSVVDLIANHGAASRDILTMVTR
ncbi:MAG: WbqC family protein [Gemmatimonadaceae bacterium]|nr:WbqC family protein [Gemmatimonadaceae bacterium]